MHWEMDQKDRWADVFMEAWSEDEWGPMDANDLKGIMLLLCWC